MTETLNSKSNTKKSFSWTSLILIFLFLVFGAFFAFKIFGKTTHNIEFSVNGMSNFSIEEILDIKVYKNDNSVETLRGSKMNISDGENLRIEVSLNEGFEASQNPEGNYVLSATGIEDSYNSIAVYNIDHFEWNTDTIKSDRKIEIHGINRKKLIVEEPIVINSSGENLNLEDFCSEWKNYVNYDEKYEFELNLNPNDNYNVKYVKALIDEDNNSTMISSKINKTDDYKYNITLYDESSEFGGIKNNIVNIEILLESSEEKTEDISNDISEKKVTIIGNEESLDINDSQNQTILFEDSLDTAASSINIDSNYEEIPSYDMFTGVLNNLLADETGADSEQKVKVTFEGTNVFTDNVANVEIYGYTGDMVSGELPSYPGKDTTEGFEKLTNLSKDYEVGIYVYFYIKALGEYSQSTPNLSFGGDNTEDITPKDATDYKIIRYNVPNNDSTITINNLTENTYPITFKIRDNELNESDEIKFKYLDIQVSDDNQSWQSLERCIPNSDDDIAKYEDYYITRSQNLYVKVKPLDIYNKSNLTFNYEGFEENTKLNNNGGYFVGKFKLSENIESGTIYVDGFEVPNYSVSFNLPEGVPGDGFEIWRYYGSDSSPTPTPENNLEQFVKLIPTTTNNTTTFIASEGYTNLATFYIKKVSNNYADDWKVTENGTEFTLDEDLGYKILKLTVNDNRSIDITNLELNKYTVTFKLDGDNEKFGYKLSDRITIKDNDKYSITTNVDGTYGIIADYNTIISCDLIAIDNQNEKISYTLKNVSVHGQRINDSSDIILTTDYDEINDIITIKDLKVDSNIEILVSDVPYKTYDVYVSENLSNYGAITYGDSTLNSNTATTIKKYGISESEPLKLKLNGRYILDNESKLVIYNKNKEIINEHNFKIKKDKDINGYYYITLEDNILTEDVIIDITNIAIDYPYVTFNCNNSNVNLDINLDGNKDDWNKSYQTALESVSEIQEGENKKNASVNEKYYIDFKITINDRYYLPTDATNLINNKYISISSNSPYELINISGKNSTAQEIYLRLYVENDATLTLNKLDYKNFNVTFSVSEEYFNDKLEIYSGGSASESSGIISSYNPNNHSMIFGTLNSSLINSYSFDNRNNKYIAIKPLAGTVVFSNSIQASLNSKSVDCQLLNGYYVFNIKTLLENSGLSMGFDVEDLNVEISGIDKQKFEFNFENINSNDYGASVKINGNDTTIKDNKLNIDYSSSVEIVFTKNSGSFEYNNMELPVIVSEEDKIYTEWYENSREINKFTITIPKANSNLSFEITENVNLVSYVSLLGDAVEYIKLNKKSENAFTNEGKLTENLECNRGETYYFGVKVKNTDMYDLSTIKFNASTIGSGTNISTPLAKIDANIENLTEDQNLYYIYEFKIPETNSSVSYSITGIVDLRKHTISLSPIVSLADDEVTQNELPNVSYYIENESNTITEIKDIEYGKNAKFKVIIPDIYNRSNFKVRFYDEKNESNEVLTDSDGYYVIYNIHGSLKVQVEDLRWNRYAVAFPNTEGLKFMVRNESGTYLDYTGKIYYAIKYSNCVFKIEVNPGYEWKNTAVNVKYTDNGQDKESSPLPNNFGEYTLSNIESEYVVSVEDASILSYKVKFVPVDGVTYYSDTGFNVTGGTISMKYGTNYEFSVGIGDNYSDSISGMYVVIDSGSIKINTTIQKLSSARYMIQNIAGDIEIRMANVTKNRYPITLTDAEGIDYYDSSGRVITGENEVECGSNFSFLVKLYSSYSDSQIRVMLGNVELDVGDDGLYTVEEVYEAKTVTVVGIEKTAPAKLVDDINKLPQKIENSEDVDLVISASKAYDALDDSRKSEVTNYNVLQSLQESLSEYHHISNGVTLEGLGWHIKLIANPIMSNIEACARIYEKLNSEYIISLYDVYLWDTLNDQRYKLSEGEVAVVHLPTPDMSYFKNPSGIHEADDGKIDYLTLNIKSDRTSMETSALSPLGIIANRTSEPGRSSLIDAIDANLSYLTDYTLNALTGKSNNSDDKISDLNHSERSDNQEENIESKPEEHKVIDNSKMILGSALKLILILMIIGIIFAIIFALWKRYKNDKNNKSD